jgi:hypothetical protein
MHIGPPKTATSSIQNSLSIYKDDLKKNNIAFIGKNQKEKWDKGFSSPAYCLMYLAFQQTEKNQSTTCINDLNATLQMHYNAKQNVILSDEVVGIMLTEKSSSLCVTDALETFKELTQDWDVQILIGYR